MTQSADNILPIPDLIMPDRVAGYTKGHETREAILRTALALLIDEGWPAMTLRRIAAVCGIRFGNLTYHYRTREDLVRELLEAVIASYEREFDAIIHLDDPSPEEQLERYCRLVLDDIPNKKTTRLFPELWALSNHDPFVHERMHDLYARARAPLDAIVAAMRPDLAQSERETLVLFISFSMEGATMFAGYNQPFVARISQIKHIAIGSFVDLVRGYQPINR